MQKRRATLPFLSSLHRKVARVAYAMAAVVMTAATVATTPTQVEAATLCGNTASFDCLRQFDYGAGSTNTWAEKYYRYAASSYHNCTRFAAFYMDRYLDLPDPGASFGDAGNWGLTDAQGGDSSRTSLAELGYAVDQEPAVGAIAWWTYGARGTFGHVGIVVGVDATSITVASDYYDEPVGSSDVVRISRTAGWPTGFIHVEGQETDASERLVTAADGSFFFAAIKENGALYTRMAPAGSGWDGFVRQGTKSDWAQVSMAAHEDGPVTMIAVKENGDLWTKTWEPGSGWGQFVRHGAGGWSTDAVPVITPRPGSGITFAALKANGTLYQRNLTSSWSGFLRHGTTNSWAAVEMTTDEQGNMWLAAVKKNGDLYTRRAVIGQGWDGFVRQGTGGWSTSSAPAITPRPGSGITLVALKANGTLYQRNHKTSWSGFLRHGTTNSWAA